MKRWNLQSSFATTLLLALIVPILAACGGQQPAGGAATPAGGAAATSAPVEGEATTAPAEGEATTAPAEGEATAAPAEEATAAPAEGEATAEPAGGTEGGKVLRIHQISTPDVVDPQKSSFTAEIVILSLNYEGLTKLDSELQAAPAAAESWEFSEDGKTLTFHLREGLTYSDGSPLTAENFRYAVERTCDPATAGEYQSILFEIAGCEDWASTPVTDTAKYEEGRNALGAKATDERTLVLTFTKPAPYYTYISGIWVFYPAKKELIEAGGENWWQKPENQIGNGPFQLTRYEEGQLVAFEANEKYWDGRAKLDGVELVYQKDTAVALEAYKAGQLDIMQPDPSQLDAIQSDATLSKEFVNYAGASTFGWGHNLTKEPFNDPKVVEAFAYAFDRQTYCEVIRKDCIPTTSWIPEGVAGSIKTDMYSFDPEKAKQALAESSYGGPEKLPEIKITYNADDPATQPRVEWVAGQYREILGINVTLDPVEGKTLSAMRKSVDTYPMACFPCGNWFQDYPDPQNWLSVYWTCDGFATRVGYCNKKLDEIIAQADVELDPQKRTPLYEQASQVLLEQLPGGFLYHLANQFLVKSYVTGYTPTSADSEWPGQWGSALTIDIQR